MDFQVRAGVANIRLEPQESLSVRLVSGGKVITVRIQAWGLDDDKRALVVTLPEKDTFIAKGHGASYFILDDPDHLESLEIYGDWGTKMMELRRVYWMS